MPEQTSVMAPGLILILGGLLLPLIPSAKARAYLAVALPLASLAQMLSIPLDTHAFVEFWNYPLELIRYDRLSRLFGIIFHIAATLCMLYMLHVRDRLEHASALVYAGAAIGATFAGDMVTLFIYWELTAISSVFLIWCKRTERAYAAGMRYLLISVISGVLLLTGSIIYYAANSSIAFRHIGLEAPGGLFILLAFGVKAAFPLMHNWLQDAYPESTEGGTVVLASFSTKLAIYALARSFAGESILIPIGAVMTAFPIFFAVIENDMRRVLAYSLNNQLGYMVVGVGIGTELAINGAASHAFAHILYKGLLFMSMGAVLYRTGTVKANELGGLYKSMPVTTVLCIIGALSISALPGLSGFVTKSMVVTATGEAHLTLIFGVLLFASAGVCDHSGIKIPFFTFFAHDNGHRVKEAPWHMLLAMGIAAAFCIGIGVMPELLYAYLPYEVDYAAYTWTHVHTMLSLLLFAGLAFGVMMRTGIYPPELPSTNLDTDWFYRRMGKDAVTFAYEGFHEIRVTAWGIVVRVRDALLDLVARWASPSGLLGHPLSAGTTALWAVVLLGLWLLLRIDPR